MGPQYIHLLPLKIDLTILGRGESKMNPGHDKSAV